MNGDPLLEANEELRDIQGYQAIVVPEFVWWILIFIAVVSFIFLVYKFFLSKKKEIVLTVYEKTLQNLNALDTQTNSKEFYLEYSDIVRNYLLERVDLNLFDRTLNELRAMLDKNDVFDMQSKNQLLNIFARADMAKFAKQDISPEKRLEHLDKTKEILEKVEFKLEGGQADQSPIDFKEVEV